MSDKLFFHVLHGSSQPPTAWKVFGRILLQRGYSFLFFNDEPMDEFKQAV